MSQHTHRNIPEDEIDLRSAGSRIFSVITYPISLLLQNFITSLAFAMLAVLLAVVLKYAMPPVYESAFIIRPVDRSDRLHLKVLGDLRMLWKLDDANGLARELGLTEETVKSIRGFEIENYLSTKNKLDSLNATEITLGMKDPNQIIPVQNAILSYLERNPYYSKLSALQKNNTALKSELIKRDIAMLDSLKRLQLSSYDKMKVNEQNGFLLKELMSPTATYTLAMERLNQRSVVQWQMAFPEAFYLVKGALPVQKPNWPPRILILCAVLVPASLFLCFLLLYFKSSSAARNKPR